MIYSMLKDYSLHVCLTEGVQPGSVLLMTLESLGLTVEMIH